MTKSKTFTRTWRQSFLEGILQVTEFVAEIVN